MYGVRVMFALLFQSLIGINVDFNDSINGQIQTIKFQSLIGINVDFNKHISLDPLERNCFNP